jgi:hypothetical protein
MEPFRGGNNSDSDDDDFPSCFYSNDSCSMEAIISKSWKANTASGYTASEDIIAVVGAIPSSIIIYISVYYDLFPRPAGQITYVLAIAIGSTVALHFAVFRLLARSITI